MTSRFDGVGAVDLDALRADVAGAVAKGGQGGQTEAALLVALAYPRLDTELRAARAVVERVRMLRAGMRTDARGMGETLPVDYEMPPSVRRAVERLLDPVLADYDAATKGEP